jgi:hypothetical protein
VVDAVNASIWSADVLIVRAQGCSGECGELGCLAGMLVSHQVRYGRDDNLHAVCVRRERGVGVIRGRDPNIDVLLAGFPDVEPVLLRVRRPGSACTKAAAAR